MNEDKCLYEEFLKGDKSSFDKIIDKYLEKMIYFILGYVGKIDIAEDLAQDVFVYLLVNKENYDFKYSLKTYLYMIAKCRALNYLKSAKCTKELFIDNYKDYEDIVQIEEIIFNNIRDQQLKEAINRLNPKQARIFYLAKIEEVKIKDISKILNISESDVKISIHRGMKKLKKILGKEIDFYV